MNTNVVFFSTVMNQAWKTYAWLVAAADGNGDFVWSDGSNVVGGGVFLPEQIVHDSWGTGNASMFNGNTGEFVMTRFSVSRNYYVICREKTSTPCTSNSTCSTITRR